MGRESNRYGIYTYNLDNNFGNRITLPHPNDAKHKHTKISIAGWQAGKQADATEYKSKSMEWRNECRRLPPPLNVMKMGVRDRTTALSLHTLSLNKHRNIRYLLSILYVRVVS